MEENVSNLIKQVNTLNYEDKLRFYRATFCFGYLNSPDFNDRLVLLSLVGLTYQKMKLKNPTITPIELLIKITGYEKDNSSYFQFLETVSIVVEDMSYAVTNIDSCGLTNSKDIINKIKELLGSWLPF